MSKRELASLKPGAIIEGPRSRRQTTAGEQYRSQIADSYSRAATRKETMLEKYANILSGQINPEVESAREKQGELFDQITAYQNTPGKSPADEEYKKLKILYELATNNLIRTMKKVIKEASAPAAAAATGGASTAGAIPAVPADAEDAELAADDDELMKAFGGLTMGGGYRRRRTNRRHRKSRKGRKSAHRKSRRHH